MCKPAPPRLALELLAGISKLLKLLNEVAVAVILPDFVKAPDSVSLRITTNTLMITRVCTLYKM